MKVKRICFVGTRTGNFDATSALFRDVLGLDNVHAEADWSIFRLPSGRGDFVEVFGPGHENASLCVSTPTTIFPAAAVEAMLRMTGLSSRVRSVPTGRADGQDCDGSCVRASPYSVTVRPAGRRQTNATRPGRQINAKARKSRS